MAVHSGSSCDRDLGIHSHGHVPQLCRCTLRAALRVSDTMPAPRTGWGGQRLGGNGSVFRLQEKEEKEVGDFLVKKKKAEIFILMRLFD